MKKFSILFIAFLMLFSANIFAVDYDLWVAGVQVTDANKNDITSAANNSGNGTASGIITYNSTTNTLTLNNATANITINYVASITNQIPNLTINLIGENYTIATNTIGNPGIVSEADFKITGSGSLTINAYYGISLFNCNLSIENTTVNATEVYYKGICGDGDNNSEVLSITNSTVRAYGTNGSICNINNLILNNCLITQPENAVFDASQHAVCLNGSKVKTEVVIEPPTNYYSIWIADMQVNNANQNNISTAINQSGNPNISATGTIIYNPTTNTLTLDGASINANVYDGIENEIENLTINLLGENTISADYGINLKENTIITGNGSLTINSNNIGIYHGYCNLTIENTTITAIGTNFGIRGYNGNNEVLSITNSTVKATGTNTASIYNINNLVLNGCAITQPEDAVFNASQHAIYDNGTIVKTEVVIEPVYDLWVAGVRVTGANKDDITSAVVAAGKDASGTITYDPTSNTLTLDNAIIGVSGIDNNIPDLTINLLSENTIISGIESYQADFKITGSGSLYIDAIFGISIIGCNLSIENTSVTAIGSICGIIGDNGNEVLTITNSTVKATGTNNASIQGMSNLVLNGCAITQPEGAAFDVSQGVVCVDGEIVTTEVVIEPVQPTTYYDLYVAGVQITDANKDNITSAINPSGQEDVSASGNISYDPTSNTLTLDNATIIYYEDGIYNEIPNLRINLIGENSITANWNGIHSYSDFTITGSGSLTINNAYYGIYQNKCDLTIENTTVITIGVDYGITGDEDYDLQQILTITNSTVKATGTEEGSIANINNLVLNGCAITQPEGAAFDVSQKGVCLNGTLVKTEVLIEPTVIFTEYDLYVNEIQVTSNNATDILGNGTVTYDPTNNKLTLNNATITCNNQGIVSQIENLTINLIGQNTITSEYCMLITKNTTITGTGSLYATTTINGIGIYQNNCNLTIDNTTVTVIGDFFGICGDNGNNEVLSINNSTVKVRGTYGGSIIDINNLVLNGCEITQPAGAIFDASQHAVSLNGEIVTSEVVIAPTAPATYTVSGTVTDGTNPIAGVTITYNGGATTTAADGTYSFISAANTTHTVTASKLGYSFTPASLTVNVAQANVTGQDFVGTAVATYTVSGTVTALADNSPIAGVTITYNGGGINGTATTAADGSYSFTANANTTYTVVANKTGFAFSPATKTVNVAEANVTGIDFHGTVTYIVEGIVRDNKNDNPIAGVTISYTGGTTTTASNGIFSFTATANTTYIVTPSKAGYTFTPTTKTVNVTNADVIGVIFYGTANGTPVDETEINAITVYPNPASDYIKVAGLTGNEEILVFDINGRIVKTLEANDNIETISINDLAKGSYMIKVRKENKIEVFKFIK